MPSEERKVEQKELPFITPHELAGEEKGVFSADLRIFRKNIWNQYIFIMFDDPADHCKVPEGLKQCPYKHDPRRVANITQFVKKEDFGYRGLAVVAVLEEKTFLTDQKQVADKSLVKKGK